MHRSPGVRVVALLACSLLLTAGISAQQEEDARRYMIGLLEIPSVLGTFMSLNSEQTPASRPIKIYSAPTTKSRLVAVVDDREKIIWTKLTSEEFGAVAYQKKNGWYLIGLEGSRARGWVSPSDAGKFIPVDRLLVDRMAYLNEHWDKRIWSLPSRASSTRRWRLKGEGNPPSYDVNITAAKRVKHILWLRIEILGPGRCRGLEEPKVIARGWVPAYTAKGDLVAWYYSGGC